VPADFELLGPLPTALAQCAPIDFVATMNGTVTMALHLPLNWLAVASAFLLTAALTPLVRRLACALGMVARPKSDRWHKQPTAMLGGVAIFVPVVIISATMVAHTASSSVLLGCSGFLFLVGLVDDFLHLKPYQKLAGQLVGSMPVLYHGLTLPWTGLPQVDAVVTVFWLVGITNALNLLDNMDGLAAGVALIAAAFLGLNFAAGGDVTGATTMAVFAAALLGFLVYNSNPASIFMGDCGSLFVGFFLAGSALVSPVSGRSRSVLPVLAVPVLTLFIPIFDTVFVTVLRKLAGRSVSQGGRDHTSHRLVALGLSERRAVWMLYGLATVSGLLAFTVRGLELDVSLALITGFTIVLVLLGTHLAGVKVYDQSLAKPGEERPLVSFLVDLSYKRRLFEMMLDVLLIVLSYYTAHALVFGPVAGPGSRSLFLQAVPVLVTVRLSVFLVAGVYRGLWRYVSLDSLMTMAEAVGASTVLSVLALLFVFQVKDHSRVVFVLDGLILLFLMSASRITFRLLRRLMPPPSVPGSRRVLIYGAGDGGELLLRELLNNPALGFIPVGFADDDPLKIGKVLHGLRVLGGGSALPLICREHHIDEVMISSSQFPAARVEQIAHACECSHVCLRQMKIQIEILISTPTADSRDGHLGHGVESQPLGNGSERRAGDGDLHPSPSYT
jgi:UDP-GlcNAc:undecaprenyl-phosphate GlcNAc-1-phosphate transferase